MRGMLKKGGRGRERDRERRYERRGVERDVERDATDVPLLSFLSSLSSFSFYSIYILSLLLFLSFLLRLLLTFLFVVFFFCSPSFLPPLILLPPASTHILTIPPSFPTPPYLPPFTRSSITIHQPRRTQPQ